MFPVASNRLFRASRLILHAFREFRLARNSRDTRAVEKRARGAKIGNDRGREKKKRKKSFIVTAWISLKYIKMWFIFPIRDNFSICHSVSIYRE